MALISTFSDPVLSEVERTLNRAFNSALFPSMVGARLAAPASPAQGTLHLPMDIVETDAGYELHADAPGMGPDDVKVELHDGVLTLTGQRKLAQEHKDASGKVWRSERTSYSFSRAFTLPETANPEAISASMDRGVLTVTVAKREPKAKPEPKRIAVTGA